VYCPGDVVEGWLYLDAYCGIPSRGVRVELSHTSRCAWYQSSGGNETVFVGERVHFRSTRTVWGGSRVYASDAAAVRASQVGCAVTFSTCEGEVLVPLSAEKGSLLALRVQREGGLCLAACVVDVDALLASVTSAELGMTMPDTGNRASAAVTVSAVLSAADEENPDAPGRQGMRRVLLTVHSLRGLVGVSPGDAVACELYELPAAPALGEPVPEPQQYESAELPLELAVPFRFRLPPGGLPSSLEYLPRELNYYNQGGLRHGFVRCNLDASIDTGGGGVSRITARATVTIVQPTPPSMPRLLLPGPPAGSTQLTVYPKRWFADFIPDGCLGEMGFEDRRAGALGVLTLDASLGARGVAAGGTVQLRLRAANSTPHDAALRVEFVRLFSLRDASGVRYAARSVTRVLDAPLPSGSDRSQTLALRVPILAPDFHGSRATGDEEPLRWRTLLRVSAELPDTPYADPYVDLPLFICGAPPEGTADVSTKAAVRAAAKAVDAKTQVSYLEADADHDAFDVIFSQSDLESSADVAEFLRARSIGDDETWPLTAQMAEPPGPPPRQGGRHNRLMVFRAEPPDKKAPQPSKGFAPTYFVVTPPKPLLVASPHAASEPLVNVAHRPPGALMLCPHTQVNFTVPYPPMMLGKV